MGLRINAGSGQRPFGLPRPVPSHNHACELCGLSAENHDSEDPDYHHPVFDFPHRYIPSGPDAWVNVDIQGKWNPDIVADCASMPMFRNGSADLIVSHHNVEHYGCGESASIMRECLRILASGGSMIICAPDMRALASAWLQGRIDTQVYMTNVYGAYMDHEADRHKWGFDADSLKRFLLSCGFSRVKPFNWREIPATDIARDWWILAIEAVK